MLEKLKQAAMHINEMNLRAREEAGRVRNSNTIISNSLEKDLIKEIKPVENNFSVCAVDGGLLSQEMHGVDLIIGRAAAVNFKYSNSKLKTCEYYPDPFPEPSYSVETGLDEHESNCKKSLFRLELEIKAAIESMEKFQPEILLLDGSLMPLTSDKPAEDSILFESYKEIINLYKKLYSESEKRKCLLCGIIKDSRGKRFMDSIKSLTTHRTADTVFLNHLLNEKERTFTIKYTEHKNKHLIARDLGEWADKTYLFYMKPVKNDRPLRVEFLSSVLSFDEIASKIYSLSSINKSYGYPSSLIEADLRAAMDPNEMERMQKMLQMLSSNDFVPLRRNSRPFR